MDDGDSGAGPGIVSFSLAELKRICKLLRTNEILGAAAADALEAAAGLASRPASPPGKPAKQLRSKVAMARDEPDEIPDLPKPKEEGKKKGCLKTVKRASVTENGDEPDAAPHIHDNEEIAQHVAKDAEEPPELNLNPKQNHMRTDLEMWVMDEIPALYGVDDSEELSENLQEDAQALKVTQVIGANDAGKRREILERWLEGECEKEARETFITEVLDKVQKIQDAGGKKKKNKGG
jgi:hypothetical protein